MDGAERREWGLRRSCGRMEEGGAPHWGDLERQDWVRALEGPASFGILGLEGYIFDSFRKQSKSL